MVSNKLVVLMYIKTIKKYIIRKTITYIVKVV